MGHSVPKQFIELNGKPILMWTVGVFDSLANRPEIIVVLPQAQVELWEALCQKYRFGAGHRVAVGGKERFFSVKNGLALIHNENSTVAIHDGVRPLASCRVIEECYDTAERLGSAIPVVNPVDTVRVARGDSSATVPRNSVLLVQTPQVFKTDLIRRCYEQPFSENFTDDASVVEALGKRVVTVSGNRENIKITNRADLLMAKALLELNNP